MQTAIIANPGTCLLRNTSAGLSRSPRQVFSHQAMNVKSTVAATIASAIEVLLVTPVRSVHFLYRAEIRHGDGNREFAEKVLCPDQLAVALGARLGVPATGVARCTAVLRRRPRKPCAGSLRARSAAVGEQLRSVVRLARRKRCDRLTQLPYKNLPVCNWIAETAMKAWIFNLLYW